MRITIDMAKSGSAPRKIRIYTDGVYDLFHQGHARQFMQAKNLFPNSEVYLIIGACSDKTTHALKGRTVMTDTERYEAIRHCRYVDEIIRDVPWKITKEFLEKHKIDFVAQDATPYVSEDCDDVYKDVKEWGYFLATERTQGEFKCSKYYVSIMLMRLTSLSQAFPHQMLCAGSSETTTCTFAATFNEATAPKSSTCHF